MDLAARRGRPTRASTPSAAARRVAAGRLRVVGRPAHPTTEERLKAWAKYIDRQVPTTYRDIPGDTLNPQIMGIWRMRLSCALLLGPRVGLVFSALDKLAGVSARSSTLAYRIAHPLYRAQEFGRLRR